MKLLERNEEIESLSKEVDNIKQNQMKINELNNKKK